MGLISRVSSRTYRDYELECVFMLEFSGDSGTEDNCRVLSGTLISMEKLKLEIRSMLTNQWGLEEHELIRDYKDLQKELRNEEDAKFPLFGCNNVRELLSADLSDAVYLCVGPDGKERWKAKPSSKDKHIHDLNPAPSRSMSNFKAKRIVDT